MFKRFLLAAAAAPWMVASCCKYCQLLLDSTSHESMLEHLGVNLALLIVSLESLNDEVIRVISISSHLLLEHLDHVVVGARSGDLAEQTVELGLAHEHTDVVEGAAQVVLVQLAILVDVHQLEAVLVHLQLLLGEASLILTPANRIWFNCYVTPPPS